MLQHNRTVSRHAAHLSSDAQVLELRSGFPPMSFNQKDRRASFPYAQYHFLRSGRPSPGEVSGF